MEKVIPPGLNYADIKPEAIENQIRIIRYTPIATVQSARPNDVIRFHLQGNGFYDPYSAYLRVQVTLDGIVSPTQAVGLSGKFLDRSAHSLFTRLVIRSQGTELERIEHYDVIAAMINDMIYSQEQRMLHHYEGFAAKEVPLVTLPNLGVAQQILSALPLLVPKNGPTICSTYGDVGAWRMWAPQNVANTAAGIVVGDLADGISLMDRGDFRSAIMNSSPYGILGLSNSGAPFAMADHMERLDAVAGGIGGARLRQRIAVEALQPDQSLQYLTRLSGADAALAAGGATIEFRSPTTFEFCIPIYSGIIGVLMPDKKLLPLSLLPLEVELTVNPYAFYPVGTTTNRNFTITRCEIYSHTLFFEQELHRSLEAIVAETGIFLHYNTFYLGPINQINAIVGTIGGYNQIGVYLKSIQSIHWTYLYNSYDADNGPRKLSFSSHNLSRLQLRNGMDLIPSEPLEGLVGSIAGGDINGERINYHSQMLIETYKGWNKMHDPLSDSAINPFNWQIDAPLTKPATLQEFLKQQLVVGRCQYALTLEGEELGQQKSIISGKKSVMPFDLNITGFKSADIVSFMLTYLKADFICYVRPDLVVTRLGL